MVVVFSCQGYCFSFLCTRRAGKPITFSQRYAEGMSGAENSDGSFEEGKVNEEETFDTDRCWRESECPVRQTEDSVASVSKSKVLLSLSFNDVTVFMRRGRST